MSSFFLGKLTLSESKIETNIILLLIIRVFINYMSRLWGDVVKVVHFEF